MNKGMLTLILKDKNISEKVVIISSLDDGENIEFQCLISPDDFGIDEEFLRNNVDLVNLEIDGKNYINLFLNDFRADVLYWIKISNKQKN